MKRGINNSVVIILVVICVFSYKFNVCLRFLFIIIPTCRVCQLTFFILIFNLIASHIKPDICVVDN